MGQGKTREQWAVTEYRLLHLDGVCALQFANISTIPYGRSVKLIFTGGHISLMVAFKGPNVELLALVKE